MADAFIVRHVNESDNEAIRITNWTGSQTLAFQGDIIDLSLSETIAAHDRGDINLSDYWAIGDERTVQLGAISAKSNGAFSTAMNAQNITLVLMNEGYTAKNSGSTKVGHYVVGQKSILSSAVKMDYDWSNTGAWNNCDLRNELDSTYYNALPSDIKSLLKTFTVYTAVIANGNLTGSSSKVSLFAEKELGYSGYSPSYEHSVLNVINYFSVSSSHRDVGSSYWTRSEYATDEQYFICMTAAGGSTIRQYNKTAGLRPFFVI